MRQFFFYCAAVGILQKTASFKMLRIKSVTGFTVFCEKTHGVAHMSKKSRFDSPFSLLLIS